MTQKTLPPCGDILKQLAKGVALSVLDMLLDLALRTHVFADPCHNVSGSSRLKRKPSIIGVVVVHIQVGSQYRILPLAQSPHIYQPCCFVIPRTVRTDNTVWWPLALLEGSPRNSL